jgi:diadenosine tetraphosphate (Ap4A) HIT family hydrolase
MAPSPAAANTGGIDCPICDDIYSDAAITEEGFKVCDLSIFRLRLMRNQFVRGYSVLTCLDHAREPYQLPIEKERAFFDDLMRVGRSLDRLLRPTKMNFEIQGNGVPHVHCHIKPRYYGDSAPGLIIDQNARMVHLSPTEYQKLCGAIRADLLRTRWPQESP